MCAVKKILLLIGLGVFVADVQTSDEIVARILGGPQVAELIAMEMGYDFKGQIKNFPDTYLLLPSTDYNDFTYHSKRGMMDGISNRIFTDDRIAWVERQRTYERQKRDYLPLHSKRSFGTRSRRKNDGLSSHRQVLDAEVDLTFNDELWSQEWYMQDTRTMPTLPKLDLNVLPVYRAGITGKNIRISILDDGLEHTHDDLKLNYDPEISWDCNDNDADPMPRYDKSRANSHGTRCAGEVAMIANNKKCGVGIAHNSKIGGIKLLDGIVNDRIEATALGFAHTLVDIYSASWGPNDDGRTVDGPGRLTKEALERGITQGRNGSGSIFVWASGNGGSQGDNCNCDGYLNSPYTVSIGSASQRGEFPWYGEACASTLAVTYSSGAYKDQMIATTDLHNECTIKHTGTSGSAPLAAGIIALALEVNPTLSWRDVQHLIAWTSELAPVSQNPGWQQNAAGFWFNIRFGFGLMNAYGLVQAARNWTNVADRQTCQMEAFKNVEKSKKLSYMQPVKVEIDASGECSRVKFLEHVEVVVSINYTIRGALELYLTSPAGTKVQLLAKRNLDLSGDGFTNWSFLSVMTWGEDVNGVWLLEIVDTVGPAGNEGFVSKADLILHGVNKIPQYMKSGARNYNRHYNRLDASSSSFYDLDNEIDNYVDVNANDYFNLKLWK